MDGGVVTGVLINVEVWWIGVMPWAFGMAAGSTRRELRIVTDTRGEGYSIITIIIIIGSCS